MLRAVLAFFIYAAVRGFLASLHPPLLIDDAYITLRYARNLVEHSSFTYHIGDPVFGISTILYALLLALLYALLPLDLVSIDRGLNICIEYLCILLLVRLFSLADAKLSISILLAIITLWNPLMLSASQGGMETPLYLLWLLIGMLYAERALLYAALSSGLALFTRPEGAISISIVALLNLREKKRLIYPILALFIVGYIGFYYIGFAKLYPASVEIKSFIKPKDSLKAFFYFIKAPALLIPLGSIPWQIRLAVVSLCSIYGFFKWPQYLSRSFALGIILLNIALYSVANPPLWYWYPAPMITFVAIFFFWGLYQLFGNHLSILLFLAASFLAMEIRWSYFAKTLLATYTHRVGLYKDVVNELKSRYGLTEHCSIFTHEIGAVGYYSKAHIYDAVGLINPSLFALGVEKKEQGISYGLATRRFLLKTSPDFLLIQKNLIASDVRKWSEFKKYTKIMTVPNSAIDPYSGDLEVYYKEPSSSLIP